MSADWGAPSGGGSDSVGVVADTFDVGLRVPDEAVSHFSAKVRGAAGDERDDAPSSAAMLSEEQVRPTTRAALLLCCRAFALLRALSCRVQPPRWRASTGSDTVALPCRAQKRVTELVLSGASVFFTGSAGVGKSWLLAHIVSLLKQRYGDSFPAKVAITAATGIASTHISGTTLHSHAGVGVPQRMADFQRMYGAEPSKRWRQLDVLIVDEISMVSAEFWTALERGVRAIRGSEAPFGGIQLVLSGDFAQLPPVSNRAVPGQSADLFLNRGFAFQSPVWNRSGVAEVLLTKVFRQSDEDFVAILNDLREGRGQAALAALQRRCGRPLPATHGIKPTELYSRNADVDAVNARELQSLDFPLETYNACDGVVTAEELRLAEEPRGYSDRGGDAKQRQQTEALQRHEFWRDCTAQKSTQLKLSAQVMLLRNLDLTGGATHMLVNGSRGVVSNILAVHEVVAKLREEVKQLKAGILPPEFASRSVGDALTVLTRRLSRVEQFGHATIPVVTFRNGVERVIYPESFEHEVHQVGKCTRLQVPLKLSWAITIHKCQARRLRGGKPQTVGRSDPPPSPGHDAGPGEGEPQQPVCRRPGVRGAQPGAQPGRAADHGPGQRQQRENLRGCAPLLRSHPAGREVQRRRVAAVDGVQRLRPGGRATGGCGRARSGGGRRGARRRRRRRGMLQVRLRRPLGARLRGRGGAGRGGRRREAGGAQGRRVAATRRASRRALWHQGVLHSEERAQRPGHGGARAGQRPRRPRCALHSLARCSALLTPHAANSNCFKCGQMGHWGSSCPNR